MKPNPPAVSARKALGSMPAPLGKRPKDRAWEKGMPFPITRNKRPYNLAFAGGTNVPNAKLKYKQTNFSSSSVFVF